SPTPLSVAPAPKVRPAPAVQADLPLIPPRIQLQARLHQTAPRGCTRTPSTAFTQITRYRIDGTSRPHYVVPVGAVAPIGRRLKREVRCGVANRRAKAGAAPQR